MISIEDMNFFYEGGNFSLTIPELSIGKGEKVGFIGPSGSGKTTLLHLIAGILAPRSGRIKVGDVNLSDLGDAGRRNFRISDIGLIFQQFELLNYLPVRENILLPYYVNQSLDLTDEVKSAAEERALDAGIEDHLDKYPSELSQGERQRVAICRALITQPPLLLADEPTGNLDPETTGGIMDLIEKQVQVRNSTLILATHDHSLLDQFDRVINFQEFASYEG